MVIIWMEKALQALDRIEQFLFKKIQLDDDTILTIITNLEIAPSKLINMPRIGQLVDNPNGKEIRRLLVRNYKIYYEIRDKTIFIVNIFHSKEDIENLTSSYISGSSASGE